MAREPHEMRSTASAGGREKGERKRNLQGAFNDQAYHYTRETFLSSLPLAIPARNRKPNHSLPALLHRTVNEGTRTCLPVNSSSSLKKNIQPQKI